MFGTCREAFESITSADVKLDDDAGIGDRVGQRVQGAAFFRDLTARGLTGVRLVTPHRAAWSTRSGAALPAASRQRCRTLWGASSQPRP